MVYDEDCWFSGNRHQGCWVVMLSGGEGVFSAHGHPGEPSGSQFQPSGLVGRERMSSRICVCCGELMSEKGNALSRNPNICASCSSMADGMGESSMPERASPAPFLTDDVACYRFEESAAERIIRHFPT